MNTKLQKIIILSLILGPLQSMEKACELFNPLNDLDVELKLYTASFFITQSFKKSLAQVVTLAHINHKTFLEIMNEQSLAYFTACYFTHFEFIDNHDEDAIKKDIESEKSQFIHFLIRYNINLELCKTKNQWTVLHRVIASKKIKLLNLVKDTYDFTSLVMPNGMSPLSENILETKDPELKRSMNEWLINVGIDVNQCDNNSAPPLLYAVMDGYNDDVDFLLNNSANPNLIDPVSNESALFYAQDFSMIKRLLRGKASPNVQDSNGMSAFFLNFMKGKFSDDGCSSAPSRLEFVTEFLQYGGDPTLQNNEGRNLLMIAASCGYDSIIEKILTLNEIKIDLQNSEGDTALLFSIANLHPEICERLLKNNANPNLTNNDGISPLLLAVKKGSRAIATMLLNKNADLHYVCPFDNKTALMLAREAGDKNMETLLLSYDL